MAAFIRNDVTDLGENALALAITGEKLRFTRIVMGEGYIPDYMSIRDLTDMISPVVVLPISGVVKNTNDTVVFTGIFHPDQTEVQFYYREVGLYAEDPATGEEILFAYGNCGDEAELIYPAGASAVVEKTINLSVQLKGATNVSAYIPSDACATREDYEYYLRQVIVFIERAEKAITDAEEAIQKAEDVTDTVLELIPTINETNAKVELLFDAIYGELTENPFTVTFGSLDKVTVISGVWNADRQRLEC